MVPEQTERVIDRDGHVVPEEGRGIDLDDDVVAGRPAAVTGGRAPAPGGGAALRRVLPAWLAVNAAVALAIGHAYVTSAGMTPAWDAALYAHVAFAAAILVSVTLFGALCGGVTFAPGGALLVRVGAP